MVRNTEKRGKGDTNTVSPGIWRENLNIMENENCTLQDLEYGKKTEKKNVENDKYTLQDLEYSKKKIT